VHVFVAALAPPWWQHVLVDRPAERIELALGLWRHASRHPETSWGTLEIRPPGELHSCHRE
jgi:hypothetical protein